MRLVLLTVGFGCALVCVGCDWTDTAPVGEQVVVESYLLSGEPLPPVRLTMSAPVGGVYSPSTRAVRGAVVEIALLNSDGSVEESYAYRESQVEPSLYVPVGRANVRPLHTYALTVLLEDGGTVRSETLVPDTLSIRAVSADTVEYRGEQARIRLTRSEYPGRQAYIVFSSEALEPTLENATATTRRLLEEDDDLDVDDFRITSSPPINEASYSGAFPEEVEIPVPWLGIRFFGPHVIRISTVDDNLYDFMRSQLVQQGGSTFLPGEVPNVLDRVDGGTGVFGSYASVSQPIYVKRRPTD